MPSSFSALATSIEALEEHRPVDGFTFGRAPGGRVPVRVLPFAADPDRGLIVLRRWPGLR